MADILGYAIGDNFISVSTLNRTYTFDPGHPAWAEIVTAAKAQDWDTVLAKAAPAKASFLGARGRIKVDNGVVMLDGKPVHSALTQHIVRLVNEGFNAAPMIAFMEKLEANPSYRSREQLYRFVDANKITINDQGNLLLYKRVNNDYSDIHTGRTFWYKVGSEVTMARHQVDDDPNRTCSAGIHVCSLGYLASFGGARTVVCEVDPADIVAVPVDHNNSKVRCSRLKVIAEHDNAATTEFSSDIVYGGTYDTEVYDEDPDSDYLSETPLSEYADEDLLNELLKRQSH